MEQQKVGAYHIVAKLGEGGMGVVYLGEHVELGHRVAIKVLLPELTRNADLVQRFFNEARATTRIRHPGIVQIFDFGQAADGSVYFVMELLDGHSLGARLRAGVLAEGHAVALVRQVAGALAACHAVGIVHRDLKPDNIMLVADPDIAIGERAKILDFGIAKLADAQYAASLRTRTGSVMGTPYYMSPEQSRGAGHVDHRTDVYALGCILFEMLCGRPPFVGEGLGEILGMHQYVAPPAPRTLRPSLSPALEAVILRALAKHPDQRQRDMETFIAELGADAGPSFRAPTAPVATVHAALPLHPPTTLGGAAGQASPPGRSSRGLWLGVAALIVVGAGATFAAVGSGGTAPVAALPTPVETEPAPVIAPPPAPTPAPAADSADVRDLARADVLLEEIDRHRGRKRWRDVLELHARLPAGAPRERAAAAFAEASTAYVSAHQREWRALARGRRCAELTAVADDLRALVPAAAELATLDADAAACAAAVAELAAAKAAPAGASKTSRDAAPAPVDPVLRAEQAFHQKDFRGAIRLADELLARDPGSERVLIVAGLAACGAGDRDAAARYTAVLAGSSAAAVRRSCRSKGIDLPEPRERASKAKGKAELPVTPSGDDLAKAAKALEPRIASCAANYAAASSLRARIAIDASGAVTTTSVDAAPRVATCAAAVIKSAAFPASQRGATFAHVFSLR
jgi:tRNA A-37 threonylcarbamoyl transferase component Bud32